ncbi:hypothetical protein GCM10017044_10930 [Kordiimonas sediminis]|uniref:Uncharacterized protein n=1 Tax=Kordiimonas sediminis TaxID=1735581 RepID=A0A919APS2_9PROT|nr:hypothetical protein [Kordiimonas sediminis]GHF18232.1 hypothetical protein GCM10017044_10930 [Kordiimonas sediminis]
MPHNHDSDLAWALEAGAVLGWTLPETLTATLPGLLIALRGYQRRYGIDPDAANPAVTQPMTRDDLDTMITSLKKETE